MSFIERGPPDKVRAAGAGLRQTALSTPTSDTHHDSTARVGEQDRDGKLERAIATAIINAVNSELQAVRCGKIAAVAAYCGGWLDRGHLDQLFDRNPGWRNA